MKMSLSPRASLVLIFALFAGPLLVAWLMYNGTVDYSPATTRNLGDLVKPPIPIDWESLETASGEPVSGAIFAEHWVVLVPVGSNCDELCKSRLTDLRQVHRAAGRNAGRIRLAVLLDNHQPPSAQAELLNWLEQNYELFQPVTDPRGALTEPLQRAGSGGRYLIDPLGNIMMRYAIDSDPNHLKKDLKRLLTWSKLDEQ